MSPTFRSLRIRDYRLFWSGMAVSNVGTWMQRVAQDWLVLELTGSGAALGLTTGLQFLPYLLVGPFAGVLADRFPKRLLLMATQVFLGLTALVLGVLVLTDVVAVWHVFVLAAALGLGTAVDNPARQAYVAELVGPDDLTNAVGLNSASFNAARVVGPATAGFLIVLVGTGPVFLLNALSFGAPLIALLLIRPGAAVARVARSGSGGGLEMMRDGLRYVRKRPDILQVLAVVGVVGTFGLNFQMTTALVATEVFGKGAAEYGLLGSVMAVGSLTGALLAARRVHVRQRLVVLAAVVFGVLEVLCGLMPTYTLFMLFLIPVGMSALTLITAANSYLQGSVAPEVRGRVMALYLAVFMGGTQLGAPLVGWLGESYGARWSIIGGGLASVFGTLLATGLLTRHRGLVIRPHLLPRPHLDVEASQRVLAHRAGAG